MFDAEGVMLASCRRDERLRERKDFGSEYFEGDVMYLINKMGTVAQLFMGCFQHAAGESVDEAPPVEVSVLAAPPVEVAVPPVVEAVLAAPPVEEAVPAHAPAEEQEPPPPALPSALDATLLLGEYVRANMLELSKTPVDSGQLLDRVTTMLNTAGCKRKANPTLKGITQDLRRYFGAEEIMMHSFQDRGVRHAIRFPSLTPEGSGRMGSLMEEFFAMSDLERKCSIVFREGWVTWLNDFKTVYKTAMGVQYMKDPAVMQAHGFEFNAALNVCKSCKQRLLSGCCARYSRHNTTKKSVLLGMMLQ